MERAFVTGATGFVGGHLVRALAARGDRVCCLVRPTSDREQFAGLDVEFAQGDVTDLESLRGPIAEADVVYHVAAYLKAPWAEAFQTINVGGTENVARACAEAGHGPRLVVLSSLAAAGPRPEGVILREELADAPVSIYGRTKREAERRAMAFAHQVPLTILRPPGVFGDGDPALSSLYPAIQKGWHVVPGDGLQKLAFIHVADLVQAMLLAAEKGERVPAEASQQQQGKGFYIIADPAALPMLELGAVLGQAIGRQKLRVLRIPRWLFRAVAALSEAWARLRGQKAFLNRDKAREGLGGHWVCDVQKAQKQLGFTPALPLPQRLAQTIQKALGQQSDSSHAKAGT